MGLTKDISKPKMDGCNSEKANVILVICDPNFRVSSWIANKNHRCPVNGTALEKILQERTLIWREGVIEAC